MKRVVVEIDELLLEQGAARGAGKMEFARMIEASLASLMEGRARPPLGRPTPAVAAAQAIHRELRAREK